VCGGGVSEFERTLTVLFSPFKHLDCIELLLLKYMYVEYSWTLANQCCIDTRGVATLGSSRHVPDLLLCLGVLKHRTPLTRGVGGHLPAKKIFLRWIFAYGVQF
jgi:hypothetical protein